MIGPGVYDDLCSYVLEESAARAAIVIVFGGNRGHGFSGQFAAPTGDELQQIATVLRGVADEIEADARRARH